MLKILMQHCCNEKDARNLTSAFSLLSLAVFNSSSEEITESREDLCENLLRYFPITFDNSKHTQLLVSGQTLKEQLLSIFAHPLLNEELIETALVKLVDEEEDASAVLENLRIFFDQLRRRISTEQ